MLYSKGQNLGAFLYNIRETAPVSYNLIVHTVQSIAPYFGDFYLRPTENEDDVDRKWGKELPELIGTSHTYDELLSYCEGSEDGIGLAWVKNDEMMIDFELVIHDNREDDK